MRDENTLLIGQALQIRDKLVAKRHVIPSSMMSEWSELQVQTQAFDANRPFDSAIKGRRFAKPAVYSGSAKDLNQIVSSLKDFEERMTSNLQHH
ncbi:hypothetical protein [Alteromonas lipotrueiana]|uniref:hypothetical protein n=1 Tax=Alteromonas lipotrueiana TaxID=2803815 RepID=UPI001C43A311|nr:hypothetical protein [Alteromonas lipotrueiana]